jgi:uncharacterized protein with HEPN domain
LKAGRDHLDYLQDIMTMMEKIESFIAGMTKEDFIEDCMAHFAVIRAMEVMGEAAKNVPPEVRQRHPEIPGKKMAGLRDKVIHGYFGVDLFIIWESATRLIPGMKKPNGAKNLSEMNSPMMKAVLIEPLPLKTVLCIV